MKRKKGSIDISLMFIISIFLLLAMFVGMLEFMQPVVKYININQISRKYVLQMEKDGYLSPSNVSKLQNDLASMGIQTGDITKFDYTNILVNYGDEVKLEIIFNCKYSSKIINGLNVTNSIRTIPMRFYKVTTSKKG